MKFNFKEKILSILQDNKGQMFTTREIAKEIILKYPKDCEEKAKNSIQKNANLESQIACDVGTYTDKLKECGVIILNEGKILLDGSFPGIFEHENIIRKIGIEVPFEVEFCQKVRA